jgi:hypothetical protein
MRRAVMRRRQAVRLRQAGRMAATGLALAVALALLMAAGCAERLPAATMVALPVNRCAGEPSAEARRERVRVEAAAWLQLAELKVERLYDAGPLGRVWSLPAAPRGRRLAVMSYPGAAPDSPLRGRSFVYDDALALLWFTATGERETAEALAATLVALQNPDGTWGFSFSVRDGFYNAGYVRTGTVAWAAHALAVYAGRWRDAAARAAAERAGQALLRSRRRDVPVGVGLIEGGRGRWSADERTFYAEFRLPTAITEHQLDAHMALQSLAVPEAAPLIDSILSTLWLDREGRFAVAADNAGPDPARALDAAGGWGALWLLAQGDSARATRSLNFTLSAFPATTPAPLSGFRPYLDPVEGPRSALDPDLIFVEGTLGVALAAHRLHLTKVASTALQTAVELACLLGPGVPYANREAIGFPRVAAAAPTLWFLMVDREMRTGELAPLFLPARASGEPVADGQNRDGR